MKFEYMVFFTVWGVIFAHITLIYFLSVLNGEKQKRKNAEFWQHIKRRFPQFEQIGKNKFYFKNCLLTDKMIFIHQIKMEHHQDLKFISLFLKTIL